MVFYREYSISGGVGDVMLGGFFFVILADPVLHSPPRRCQFQSDSCSSPEARPLYQKCRYQWYRVLGTGMALALQQLRIQSYPWEFRLYQQTDVCRGVRPAMYLRTARRRAKMCATRTCSFMLQCLCAS